MTLRPDSPSAHRPDKAFLNRSSREIVVALSQVRIDDTLSEGKKRTQREIVKHWRKRIANWLNVGVPKETSRWEGNLRLINALLDGIRQHRVPLNHPSDARLLAMLTALELRDYPFLAEHFLGTSEAIELIHRLQKPVDFGSKDNTDEVFRDFRIQMMRLYAYDAYLAADADDEDHPVLPFEIRLHFSGALDEVSEEERQWDAQMRQRVMSDDAALTSFNLLSVRENELKPSSKDALAGR